MAEEKNEVMGIGLEGESADVVSSAVATEEAPVDTVAVESSEARPDEAVVVSSGDEESGAAESAPSESAKAEGEGAGDFAQQLNDSMISLSSGDVVKGKVISMTPTEVFVNLGYKSDGFIPLEELANEPPAHPSQVVSIGDELDVFIVRVSDVEGTVQLSVKKLEQIAGRRKLEAALEDKSIMTGRVFDAVSGGLLVNSYGTEVFIPASQSGVRRSEDLASSIGKEVSFQVIDVVPRRKKIVGSIRAVAGEVRRRQSEEFWAGVEEGKQYTGTVRSLTTFGAFVDIGGVDGLIHISELSWGKIKHPSDVLNVGDTVEVYVKSVDREKGKISLGYRKEEDNPWAQIERDIHLGDVINCRIVRLVPFGAFAEVVPGIDGLIHISQIANRHIPTPASELSIGQMVDAKVVELDLARQKIGLSIKVLLPDYVPAGAGADEAVDESSAADVSEVSEVVEEVATESVAAVEEDGAQVDAMRSTVESSVGAFYGDSFVFGGTEEEEDESSDGEDE